MKLTDLTVARRGELKRLLIEAISEFDTSIDLLEDALVDDADRLYTEDEESAKSLLIDTRELKRNCGLLLNKIELIPANVREYTVMGEDTLPHIASRILGDAAYWPVIAEANSMLDATSLVVGQRIIIPAKDSYGELNDS